MTANPMDTVKSYSSLRVRPPSGRDRAPFGQNVDEHTQSAGGVDKQEKTLQGTRTFAALKGLGVGVAPVGGPK